MRRLPGQALRLLPRLCTLALSLSVVIGLLAGGLAWRLSKGPIPIPQIVERIEAAFNRPGSPARITIGGAELAWNGWRDGLSPFEIRVRDVRIQDDAGRVRAELPEASVSLAYRWLLVGRIAPRAIELSGLRLRATRAVDGNFAVDLGGFAEAAEAEEAPPGEDAPPPFLERVLADLGEDRHSAGGTLSALERLIVHDARIHVVDAQLGADWQIDRTEIELIRDGGGVTFSGRGVLRLGEEAVPASLRGVVRTAPGDVEATLSLTSIRPALLARQTPVLAPLAALDATASLEVRAGARADGGGASLAAVLYVGPGTVTLGPGSQARILGADVSIIGSANAVRLERAVVRIPPPASARAANRPGPIVSLAGEARREDNLWTASLRGALDYAPLADLEEIWPPGVANGARVWMTENVSAGTARNGRFRLDLRAPATLQGIELTSLTGTLEAEDVTAHWLRPIQPVTGVNGTAEFGLTTVTLNVRSGRQQGTGVTIREGTLRFQNLERTPSDAAFDIHMQGPLADVMGIVRHPRLHIFDRSRVAVPELTGNVTDLRLRIGMPLIANLTMDDVRMQAEARATDVRVPRGLLGKDIERGTADLTVDMDGLRVQAQATVAEIAVRLGVEMDFRPGANGQLLSRETLSARADARQLQAFGLDLRDFVEGPIGLEGRNETRRGAQPRVTIRGDLRDSRMMVGPLGWQKPRGTAGSVEAVLRLQGEQVVAMEQLRIEAPDALIRARSGPFRQGFPERLEVLEGIIGATRFTGEARQPRNAGGDWGVTLRGSVVDISAALAETSEAAEAARQQAGDRTGNMPVAMDVRFDRVILGPQRALGSLVGTAQIDAMGVLRAAQAEARFANAGAQLRITPDGAQRRVAITSDDGGALLRLFDVLSTIEGGRLTVDAHYESMRPGAPLTGQADLADFSIRNAPGFAKLLQAMTLYGLVDALSGSGLRFTRLVAPFRLTREALELDDSRAFSASLGLTARGRLERQRGRMDMEGTIVPAYFFNQLLGNIPLIGRLFSPETGGGLFAATYRLRGPMADPTVTVNPLAALTPGFLRGIFQIGQDGQRLSPQVQQQGARSRLLPAPRANHTVQDVPLRGPPPH